MKKSFKTLILLSVSALFLGGCNRLEEPLGGNEAAGEEGGRVTFTMSFDIPGATAPATKSMDGDATLADFKLENIYIAVFTYKNYLKEFVKAVPVDGDGNELLNTDGSYNYAKTDGLYKVQFSLEKTTSPRYVHVLANVPEGIAPPDFDYLDKVLGEKLYTSGLQDGYWKYLEFSGGIQDDASAMAKFNGIKLVRNFAKVSLDAGSSGFTVKGFELYNTPTRGSFLPYQGKEIVGADTNYKFYKDWENGENAKDYSALIANYPGYLIPGATPLYRPSYGAGDFPEDTNPKFMYEHPVSPENPTYIIAKLTKGGETKFYRLDILDNVGNKSAIIRNYIYNITINSITTDGYDTPADAELNPSDYNFTLSEQTDGVDNIYSNGAKMEVEYAEKVFTKAATGVTFKYRYDATANTSTPTYEAGKLSAIDGGSEITHYSWSADDPGTWAGTWEGDGWYGVTYDVADPSAIGGDEIESTFTVTAGTGAKKIVRKVHLISMKPKTLNVTTWEYNSSTHTLDLTFVVPNGLRSSMFPLHFKFQTKDKDTEKQILSPQTPGLVSGYDSNAKIYFLKDYYYTDYQASKTITIQFKAPENVTPVLNLSDVDGYFVPQELGATYATGLAADPIANGSGNTTVFEFTYTNDTPVPITLNLTGLEVVDSSDPSFVCEGGSVSGNVFTPSGKGTKRIGLKSTKDTSNGTVQLETATTMTDPDPITVQRYSTYVTGNLVLNGDLPLKEGSSTTFSFNYSARNMLPVTISAPEVEIWNADGTLPLGDGSYTYTPSVAGIQTFTIKAKTHFADAGSISLSVPHMTNPAALTITRGTTFVIPANALNLTGTDRFNLPVYWRTDKRNNTSGALGLSHYFSSTTNTGNVTIDISRIGTDENTTVYFMYTYTQYILIVPVTRYMFAEATLEQLIEATASSKLTLPFSLHL